MDSENCEAWDPFNCLKLDLELGTTRAYPATVFSTLLLRPSGSWSSDGIAQFQQLILKSHASFAVEDFKSLNERLNQNQLTRQSIRVCEPIRSSSPVSQDANFFI